MKYQSISLFFLAVAGAIAAPINELGCTESGDMACAGVSHLVNVNVLLDLCIRGNWLTACYKAC